MQKFRFILVEPEYEMNLGAAARLLANFGQKQMHLVKPDCIIGFTANMHAKHAKNLLKNAKIYANLKEAVRGCSMVVGTTGISARHKDAIRHPLELGEFAVRVAKWKNAGKGRGKKKPGKDAQLQPLHKSNGEIAILFGRDGIGLSEKEIGMCDLLITIPTSKGYPVLNLTHAMAIVLYELVARKKIIESENKVTKNEMDYLKRLSYGIIDGSPEIKNKQKVKNAVKRVFSRAMPDEIEARALIMMLKRMG